MISNYPAGLRHYSSPAELERLLHINLGFLKKYGFKVGLPLLNTTDLSALSMNQRLLWPIPTFDVHDTFSFAFKNGTSRNNQGTTVGSFLLLITSQYKIRPSDGKFYMEKTVTI